MADVTAHFLHGLETGRQQKRQQEQLAQEQEDRQLRQQILKHQLASAKLEDVLADYTRRQQGAQQQFNAQEGQPATSFATPIPEAPPSAMGPDAMGLPVSRQPAEVVPTGPKPVTFPGSQDLGIPSYDRTPKTLEQVTSERIRAQMNEPFTLADGAKRYVGGQVVGDNPKDLAQKTPPNPIGVRTMENGKPVTKYLPPDQVSGQTYPSQPPASLQQSSAPAPVIKPNSPEFKVAQDLAYGKLTMQQFRGLYSYSRDVNKKLAMYQKASELNPNFDPAQFEAGFKFFVNPQMRQRLIAIDALSPVIDKIEELSKQVPRGDIQAFNKLLVGAKVQIGNRRAVTFAQMKTLLGDEVGNALGVGTGSDLKTKLGLDLVNPNLGDSSFDDTMEQLRTVLGQRKDLLIKPMGIYGKDASDTSRKTTTGTTKIGRFDVEVH